MRNKFLKLAFVSIGLSLSVSAIAGPISTYYLTAGDQSKIYVIQGNSLVNTINTTSGYNHPYPIAIADTIRTFTYSGGRYGTEYALDGTPTGNEYYNPSFLSLTDGTTDGLNYNYAIKWNTGTVYQFDRSWANPLALFSAGESFGGITYDSSNQSLWLNNRSTGETRNYSLTGSLLSDFNTSTNVGWGLAYETQTDSLWYWGDNDQTIRNYSKTGVLLESVVIPGVTGNILGGEMSIRSISVPAPSSLVLFGLALLALRRRS